MIFDTTFYAENSPVVARALLGQKLIREIGGNILIGMITETEAYQGASDSASHAFKGETARNAIMFGPAGFAYVYFIYGKHHMLNAVTGAVGVPGAVLLRGLRPLCGHRTMARHRKGFGRGLCDGPGKLCQALKIDKRLNGWDLTAGKKLWIESGVEIRNGDVLKGPRVGIDYALPEHKQALWRFRIHPLKLPEYVRSGNKDRE
jgi:DNA-3-methyladenine glycosylase